MSHIVIHKNFTNKLVVLVVLNCIKSDVAHPLSTVNEKKKDFITFKLVFKKPQYS